MPFPQRDIRHIVSPFPTKLINWANNENDQILVNEVLDIYFHDLHGSPEERMYWLEMIFKIRLL